MYIVSKVLPLLSYSNAVIYNARRTSHCQTRIIQKQRRRAVPIGKRLKGAGAGLEDFDFSSF